MHEHVFLMYNEHHVIILAAYTFTLTHHAETFDFSLTEKKMTGSQFRWVYQITNLHFPKKGTNRQRSGKGAISKRFPLQKPEVGKNQTNNQVPIP